MILVAAFQKCLVLLTLVHLRAASTADDSDWGYDNTEDWGGDCNGNNQSPIHINNTIYLPMLALKFHHYDVPLDGPLTVINNGHTIDMAIPWTVNGERPYISGGLLDNNFEALALHFHWGSEGVKGSEHKIYQTRYDVELHIVHKNVKYETVEEAIKHRDGLAVLGIMFKIANDDDGNYPGLSEIFNALPSLIEYESEATINDEVKLAGFLGDLNRKDFYTYSGSLTTPPCAEAVIWNVFAEPLRISHSQTEKFWNILDKSNEPLINNFRPLQPLGNRNVFRSSHVNH